MTRDLFFVIPVIIVVGGFAIVLFGMYSRMKSQERRHRERLAMIERGIMPPDERREVHALLRGAAQARRSRTGSLGVVLVALGFGLMLIIGLAGEAPDAAIGVGGAIAVLGVAFIVNANTFARNVDPGSDEAAPVAPRIPELPSTIPPDEQRPTLP